MIPWKQPGNELFDDNTTKYDPYVDIKHVDDKQSVPMASKVWPLLANGDN